MDWANELYDYCEDFLNEDCFDVDLECDSFDAVLAIPIEEKTLAKSKKNTNTAVCKSNGTKYGSKIPNESVVTVPTGKRLPQTKLYMYPSFDKSDSSIFLPSRLAKHMNSGNMTSVAKLIQLHFDKNCKIEMDFMNCNNMSTYGLVKWYGFIHEIHADSITCVRQTKVSENQIQSIVYIKFTDNRFLDASVRARVKDPALKRVLEMEKPNKRENPFRREDYPEEEYKRLEAIANAEGDKVVYITQEMTLTIDEMTSKVKGFKLGGRVTMLALAPPVPDGYEF